MTARRSSFSRKNVVLALAVLFLGAGFGPEVGTALWGEPAAESKIAYRGTLLVQLRVTKLDRAIEYYTQVLNFELVKRMDSLKWAELSFGLPNVLVGIGEGPEVKGSGTVSLNIGVTDVDKARALLEQRGVVFLKPTVEIPDKVKLADFEDPDGNRIRLAQSLAR